MNKKEQTTVEVEEKAAEWLGANMKTTDEPEMSTSAQRALFSRGVYDAIAGRIDYALSQVVPEYFHGTLFIKEVSHFIKEETIKRYPTKSMPLEGWPEIRGKLVENKEV